MNGLWLPEAQLDSCTHGHHTSPFSAPLQLPLVGEQQKWVKSCNFADNPRQPTPLPQALLVQSGSGAKIRGRTRLTGRLPCPLPEGRPWAHCRSWAPGTQPCLEGGWASRSPEAQPGSPLVRGAGHWVIVKKVKNGSPHPLSTLSPCSPEQVASRLYPGLTWPLC